MGRPRVSDKQMNAIITMRGSGMHPNEISDILEISDSCVRRVLDVFALLKSQQLGKAYERYSEKYYHIIEFAAARLGVDTPKKVTPPCACVEEKEAQNATPLDMTNTYLIALLSEVKALRSSVDALLRSLD